MAEQVVRGLLVLVLALSAAALVGYQGLRGALGCGIDEVARVELPGLAWSIVTEHDGCGALSTGGLWIDARDGQTGARHRVLDFDRPANSRIVVNNGRVEILVGRDAEVTLRTAQISGYSVALRRCEWPFGWSGAPEKCLNP